MFGFAECVRFFCEGALVDVLTTPHHLDSSCRAFFCCEGLAECSFCEGGEPPVNKDRMVFGTNVTCDLYAAGVTGVSAELCDLVLRPEGAIDFPSFCGCPGVEPPNGCSFCGDAEIINQDFTIPGSEFTCLSFNDEIAPFLLPESSICQDFEPLRGLCCEGAAQCSLCVDNNEPINIDRVIPYQDTDCKEFQIFALLDCEGLDEIIAEEADVKGFCGCPESAGTAPPDVCSMCLKDRHWMGRLRRKWYLRLGLHAASSTRLLSL